MKLVGRVVCGKGEGRKFLTLKQYSEGFEKILGEKPFAGTLNLDVGDKHIERMQKLQKKAPLMVDGFVDEEKQYYEVKCMPARIAEQNGLIIFAKLTHHPPNIVEFVCAKKMRTQLGLNDGDLIEIEI